MNNNVIQQATSGAVTNADAYDKGLVQYLQTLGLPSNVLVPVPERAKVISNIPDVVGVIPPEIRAQSHYISQFVAACGAGLFNAALNFIWDETIESLKKKIASFDLKYFVENCISDEERRQKIQSVDDLSKIDDNEIVNGCQKTGIISDIGFKHLDYIRNMRNWMSAAHPNHNMITGLQLVSWFETCIREVISVPPTSPAIEANRLIVNIKKVKLGVADCPPIFAGIANMPAKVAGSLLIALVGIYCDARSLADVRSNIELIIKAVWGQSGLDQRRQIGLNYGNYAANADIAKRDLCRRVLEITGGLEFIPEGTRASEIALILDQMKSTHEGMNNFYNEPPIAKMMNMMVGDISTVSDSVRDRVVKTVITCRCGNPYGVSWEAAKYYDAIIGSFQERDVKTTFKMMWDESFETLLQFEKVSGVYLGLIKKLGEKVINPALKSAVAILITTPPTNVLNARSRSEIKFINEV